MTALDIPSSPHIGGAHGGLCKLLPLSAQEQCPIAASLLHQCSCWLLQVNLCIFNLLTFPREGSASPLAINLLIVV